MAAYPVISFLTDYGLEDGFVAACHGVMASIAPAARIIDITHLVPPADVRRGATVLAQVVPHLPVGVHVGVVDPGVGSDRRAIAVTTARGVFVGPDNGLLLRAVDAVGGVDQAYELANDALFRHPVSSTFHGRDVFAPVAAELAAGLPPVEVGPAIDPGLLIRLPVPVSRRSGEWIEVEVLSVDRFGNVQLAAVAADLVAGSGRGGEVAVDVATQRVAAPYVPSFAAVAEGELLVFEDSAGQLALAVNGGSAAERLAVAPGALVRLAAPTAC